MADTIVILSMAWDEVLLSGHRKWFWLLPWQLEFILRFNGL